METQQAKEYLDNTMKAVEHARGLIRHNENMKAEIEKLKTQVDECKNLKDEMKDEIIRLKRKNRNMGLLLNYVENNTIPDGKKAIICNQCDGDRGFGEHGPCDWCDESGVMIVDKDYKKESVPVVQEDNNEDFLPF